MAIELLAPAGSVDALRAACIAGADAVYIGGNRYGARAYAENPDTGELLDAIRVRNGNLTVQSSRMAPAASEL